MTIYNKVGEAGLMDFAKNIGNLAVMGCIDAELMLKQIHQFSSKIDRKTAFRDHFNWLKTQQYSHIIVNDNGDKQRTECTRYVAHSEVGTWHDPQIEYISYDS